MNKVEKFHAAAAHPRSILHLAADRFEAPSMASDARGQLREFEHAYKAFVDAVEIRLTSLLQGAGASPMLMEDWDRVKAEIGDFAGSIKAEIEGTS